MQKLKNIAFIDCIKTMAVSLAFNIFYEFNVIFIQIISAKTIGSFATASILMQKDAVKNNLWILIILIFLNVVLQPFLGVVKDILLFKQGIKHHSKVISKFLNKDYLKSRSFSSGELSSRWEMDLLNYRSMVMILVCKPIVIIAAFIFMSFYIFHNFAYGVICIMAACIPVIVAYFTSPMESSYFIKNSEYEAEQRNFVVDLSSEHEYIKMNIIGEQFLYRINKNFESYFEKVGLKDIDLKSKIKFYNSISNYGAKIIVILYGVYLLSKDIILAGDIISYLGYLIPIQSCMNELSFLVRQFRLNKDFSKRILEFYTYMEKEDGKVLENAIEEIQCENLSFSYDGSRNILDNFSAALSSGKRILICGKNGSGKSTFINIISSLYSNYDGNLTVNGETYDTYNIDSFRRRVSYIEQNPYLFEGTLEENVRSINPNIKQEDIERLLERLKLDKSLIDRIEFNGANLSGGEKQKLSILRGLLREADIYFFDEPTNNLDDDSIRIVMDILKEKKCTIVFITHDLNFQSLAEEKILI